MGRHKYNAKSVDVDGVQFDSKKEADRYKYLMSLQDAGEISELQLQVPFELIPAQKEERIEYTKVRHLPKKVTRTVEKSVVYIADFVYNDRNGKRVVEDVKGYRRGQAYSVYVLKRKLMLYIHGVRIKEV